MYGSGLPDSIEEYRIVQSEKSKNVISAFPKNGGYRWGFNRVEEDLDTPPESPFAFSNPLVGNWQAKDGEIIEGTWQIKADSTIVHSPAEGKAAEYSYLIRKDRLLTLSHDGNAALREYRFAGKEDGVITLQPVKAGTAAADGNLLSLVRKEITE
jgi:hypothetical protein